MHYHGPARWGGLHPQGPYPRARRWRTMVAQTKEGAVITTTSRIRRILAAAIATAVVMAVGLPAAQADASVGSMAASLKIEPSCAACGVQSVKVEGTVTMPPSEAQSLIDRHYNVVIRLWGEDGFSDDLRLGPYSPDFASASIVFPGGLYFKSQKLVGNSVLNEDWGGDEIYAGVRLLKPDRRRCAQPRPTRSTAAGD